MSTQDQSPPSRAVAPETSDYRPNGVLVTEHRIEWDLAGVEAQCKGCKQPWPCAGAS